MADEIRPDVCVFCRTRGADQALSDGRGIHFACHSDAVSRVEIVEGRIAELQVAARDAEQALSRERGLVRTFARVMLGQASAVPRLQRELAAARGRLDARTSECDRHRRQLVDVWDYWLDYPPDWDRRRRELLDLGRRCSECGTERGVIHAHHRIPLSRGGSHRLENLVLLCAMCHSDAHGGREFGGESQDGPTAYARRMELLREAMSESSFVWFRYTDREGARTTRTVRPLGFRVVGRTTCLDAFCHLRRADRVFAVKRMRRLRRVNR